jgi:hypothetical protein
MAYTARPKAWFWIFSFFLVAWFIAGLFIAVYDTFFFDDAMRTQMTEAQIDLRSKWPQWTRINTFLSCLFGLIGSIAMLMRKRVAVIFLALSLFCVIINTVYAYLVVDGLQLLETFDIVMSIVVILVGLLAWYSADIAKNRGWLLRSSSYAV